MADVSFDVPMVVVREIPHLNTLTRRALTTALGATFDPENTSVEEIRRIPNVGDKGVRSLTEHVYEKYGYRFRPC